MNDADDAKRPPRRGPGIGLLIRPGQAKYPRPAAGFAAPPAGPAVRHGSSLAARPDLPLLHINSHRELAIRQKALADRVAAHPQLAVMLLVNPVLAFKALGVVLSHPVANHVLHAIQHPPELRNRRDELEASLKEALGEPAQPTDAAWNAHLLFTLRKLGPLAIGDQHPAYTPPLGQAEAQKLHALRPAAVLRYPQPRRLAARNSVGSVSWKESLRRLDLKAPAPNMPAAEQAPQTVPLEDLWFYKDLDPVVHDALELGVIRRRAFPIHSPDSFRQVLAGSKPNAFRSWIERVRFNPA